MQVAVCLVEQANVEPKIVEQKKHYAPDDHRHIELSEPFGAEFPWRVNADTLPEVACGDEKHRHVE